MQLVVMKQTSYSISVKWYGLIGNFQSIQFENQSSYSFINVQHGAKNIVFNLHNSTFSKVGPTVVEKSYKKCKTNYSISQSAM